MNFYPRSPTRFNRETVKARDLKMPFALWRQSQMSKHFELMQQLEQEQSSRSETSPAPFIPSLGRERDSHGLIRWANNESLRLVQQIFLLQSKEPPRVVVFAAIDHGNGCSQICASVAEILAKSARKPVCLVETNFRSPALPELFGTTNHYGLTDALLQKGPIGQFAKPVNEDNLWLLSSGSLAVDSPSLLASERLRERVDELRHEFDFVIMDAPPLTRYSDAVALSQLSDGLVLILEADSTRREAASVVAETLRSANVNILAAVLNKRSFPIPEAIYKRL
jgi:capsular exopolysaccharide synthesis family protein